MSIRWKLLLFVAGFNVLVALILAYSVYNVSYSLFFDSFMNNKRMFAKTISKGIFGDEHARLDSLSDTGSIHYRHTQKYLHDLKLSDSTITYLYTLTYNRADSSFFYCVDGDVSSDNTLWVEAEGFAFELHCDSAAAPFLLYGQKRFDDRVTIVSDSASYDIWLQKSEGVCVLSINDIRLAEVTSLNPFVVKVDSTSLSPTNRNTSVTIAEGGNALNLYVSISPKNQPFSVPGDCYKDTPENIAKYRKLLSSGNDTADSTFKNSNYGTCISAYGVIKSSNGDPSGLVVVDFYEKELAQLKRSVTKVSLYISSLTILLVIIVLPLILELFVIKHIKALNFGIKAMGQKNFDTKITIRSRDEFETMAKGFNSMAKSLRLFYDDLEGIVRERTTQVEQQKEELQLQTENLMEVNSILNEQNDLLQKQKDKIERQNMKLENFYIELSNQKDMLEKSKAQIVSSIMYAKRIQAALLQSQASINTLLQENFIYYKPRDIVSGDFYYIREVNDTILVVAADCTGHGVPGAFMSMLGISFLNEIVQNREVGCTNVALDKLRAKIKFAFGNTGNKNDTRDGMDMSFVAINKTTGRTQFSGAYCPIWIIKKNDMQANHPAEISEIKGDSMPIGVHPKDSKPFTLHEFTLEKGDIFYLFSDGFASQFGGPNNEKFMTKRLKKTLLAINHLPMTEQKAALERSFLEWMGDNDQTDDVLVIGIKMA